MLIKQNVNQRQADVVPTEAQETEWLFEWAAYAQGRYPELWGMYHIPNEGKRSPATAGQLKAQGLKSGVPDICLPAARGGYHALYIEMKRTHGGKVSVTQKNWLKFLTEEGNCAVVCCGYEEARKTIEAYLNGKITYTRNEGEDDTERVITTAALEA